MADNAKTIENILAALAQRPPASTPPNQGQSPYPASGYPQNSATPAYPQTQPPAYPPGNYGLSQPSAPGGFDLSAIKPDASGTNAIADAIARAKAYATENGLTSHERPPPGAYAPPPAGHYRSRSRSPPGRRDAYRDNYNSHRDRGGRDYGRDRSLSPNRGRTFSPRGGANSRDRGGTDDDSEFMQIEASLVGLIIGRQGENLRRVESETGCRVQFMPASDNQASHRECRITGPSAGRAEARASINRIIEDSGMGAIARAGLDSHPAHDTRGAPGGGPGVSGGPGGAGLREGEDCMQIMVPDRTVGLIIGRGGETIRDLQERSGCHINIVGENKSVNGLRPVNLIGPHDAAAQAKELILEIVESDSQNMGQNETGGANKSRPPKNDFQRDGGGYGGRSNDKINDSIYVPSDAVGMIIGKGGETIREMQNVTGCKINVSGGSPGETQREIGLVGSRDSIERARLAIEEKVDAVRQKNSAPGGGRGGRHHGGGRRDYDNPNYGAHGSSNQQASAPAGNSADNAADPYAVYGGYNNYLAMWYQYASQNQQGGDAAKAPGS